MRRALLSFQRHFVQRFRFSSLFTAYSLGPRARLINVPRFLDTISDFGSIWRRYIKEAARY